MPNLFTPLKHALEKTTLYPVLSISDTSVETLASIARTQGNLFVQIDKVHKLELAQFLHPVSDTDYYDEHRYELTYRLAMRYEEALESSCMSDLLDLELSGSNVYATRKAYKLLQRSFYVMEISAKALITYKTCRYAPIRRVVISLNSRNDIVIDNDSAIAQGAHNDYR